MLLPKHFGDEHVKHSTEVPLPAEVAAGGVSGHLEDAPGPGLGPENVWLESSAGPGVSELLALTARPHLHWQTHRPRQWTGLLLTTARLPCASGVCVSSCATMVEATVQGREAVLPLPLPRGSCACYCVDPALHLELRVHLSS